ncbi:hypothetical protein FZEAL_10632 [Fusarium zealandicum]|uniref:Uncharacterized protein n=1 Tax=Fusarium zealandicum TaxID=1053134 RepID=A0A8H4TYV5_9HYPO|nr:hypothetical protein FZEAL_10632 [Fusarium zealandicum]
MPLRRDWQREKKQEEEKSGRGALMQKENRRHRHHSTTARLMTYVHTPSIHPARDQEEEKGTHRIRPQDGLQSCFSLTCKCKQRQEPGPASLVLGRLVLDRDPDSNGPDPLRLLRASPRHEAISAALFAAALCCSLDRHRQSIPHHPIVQAS